MDAFLQALNLPTSDYKALGLFLATGAGASLLTQFHRHFKGLTKSEERAAVVASRLIVTSYSLALSLAEYILSNGQGPVLSTVLKHFTFIVTAAHAVYWLSVNPVYKKKVLPFLDELALAKQIKSPQGTSVAEEPLPVLE